MFSTVNFAVTDEIYRKLHPEEPIKRRSGRTNAHNVAIKIEPALCTTPLGRWLAAHVKSTHREDDESTLFITLPYTEEDFQLREFSYSRQGVHLRNPDDLHVLHERIKHWMTDRQKVLRQYGEDCFSLRVIRFDWPVLGSRAANGVFLPAEYFDFCAKKIREQHPKRVMTFDGDEPPLHDLQFSWGPGYAGT